MRRRLDGRAQAASHLPPSGRLDQGKEFRRLRVAYLHQYFATPDAAGGTRSYEMARRLVAADHEVHMLTTRRSGRCTGHLPQWEQELIEGIHVHWLPVRYDNKMNYRRRLIAFVVFAAVAGPRARAVRPDVVLASSTPLTIAIPAVLATVGARAPMVFEVRDLWPRVPIAIGALRSRQLRWAAQWLERLAYRRAAKIVALSPDMKKGVVEVDGAPEKVAVIPNSCDNDLFSVDPMVGMRFRTRRPWLGERPLVVYTGTVGKVNGLSYMVRMAAAAQRIEPEMRFLVIGDGAELSQVRSLAVELGVLGINFFIEPPVPKSAMPEVLSAATVCTSFVIPIQELEANSANKFFDALAAARPIAINHGGWMAELIDDHGLGLVLNSTDPDVAAAQLCEFVRDQGALRRASAAARSIAEGLFSRDRLAKELEGVLVDAAMKR
jgi:glycosyltransferase involved in cell wall biosynthesis